MNAHFSHNLKQEYIWLPRGVTSQIINTTASGIYSIITAIMSNGDFLSLFLEDTGDSDKFWNFLHILKYAISHSMNISDTDLIIVLDNAKIHHSNITLNIVKLIGINIMFLPAYSLTLAPVELFFRMLKNEMRKVMHQKQIWFNKAKDRIEIYNAVTNWRYTWIRKMWIESITNAKQAILRFY